MCVCVQEKENIRPTKLLAKIEKLFPVFRQLS